MDRFVNVYGETFEDMYRNDYLLDKMPNRTHVSVAQMQARIDSIDSQLAHLRNSYLGLEGNVTRITDEMPKFMSDKRKYDVIRSMMDFMEGRTHGN